MLFIMRLKSINSYIFLNISPNLLKVALKVKEKGKCVSFLNSSDLPYNVFNKLYYFYNNTFFEFSEKGDGYYKNNTIYNLLKPTFYNRLKSMIIRSELEKISSDIASGSYTDLTIYNRLKSMIIRSELEKISSDIAGGSYTDLAIVNNRQLDRLTCLDLADSIETVNVLNPNSDEIIICNKIPSSFIKEDIADFEVVSLYKTDFDISKGIGRGNCVVFYSPFRVEMFVNNDRLCIVHNRKVDGLGVLKRKFSFLEKFAFRKVETFNFVRNDMPWIKYFDKYRLIMVNDYSFNNLSVKMPEKWYEKIGKMMCSGKL